MTTPVSGMARDGHLTALGVERTLLDGPDAPGMDALSAHVAACPSCRARCDEVRADRPVPSTVAPTTGLGRNGHATALGLERLVLEGGEDALQPLAQHVSACVPCRRQLALLQQVPAPSAAGEAPPRRPRVARVVGLVAALAASIAVTVQWRPLPPEPLPEAADLRVKGGQLELEVFAHDGRTDRRVTSGDTVHAGERLGFRLWLADPGFVLIVGADDVGHTYLCYPYADAGVARQLPASVDAVALEDAVDLDATAGVERIVAVRCPTAFSASAFDAHLAQWAHTTPADAPLPTLMPGCAQHETILHKHPRPTGGAGEGP